MSASNYLEQKLLEHTFRNVAYTSPTTVYLSLFSADPTETGSFTNEAGAPHARQAIAFAAYSGGSIASSNAQDFTMPAGTWTHWAVCDNATLATGNILESGALAASITTGAGGLIHLNAGDITITCD